MTQGMVREVGAGALPELEAKLEEAGMTPGWLKRDKPLVWKEMRSKFLPAHWKFEQAKELLQQAARELGTERAERRNFILRNPMPGNEISTLNSIICAYQTVLPHETAMSHRHSPHAMRILLDSDGAYSIVDGERHPMDSGDIVLTPGGHWHGHGHDGGGQAYWIDVLDVPLTHLLEPMFYEPHPDNWERVRDTVNDSPMRFSSENIQSRLDQAISDPDNFYGPTVSLPTPGMPTLTLKVSRWDAGWRNSPYRRTANTAYVVMRGKGRSKIADHEFNWSFGDVFVAPGWSRVEHKATEGSIVCSISDEDLMRWTHYYRVEAKTEHA